jgi:thiamine-phosphate pyrophosphorylase
MASAPPNAGGTEVGARLRERLAEARLYFVCETQPGAWRVEAVLDQVMGAGVEILQLRDKEADDQALLAAATAFRSVADRHGAPFLINDRPDLVEASHADGVHLGQDDVPVSAARALIGDERLIGLSTHSPEQVDAAQSAGCDYISVGPVWETPTKEGRPASGLQLVEHAAAHSELPFFAIGGIDVENAPQVVAAGATRICVVRAIRDASDPGVAASRLRDALPDDSPDES